MNFLRILTLTTVTAFAVSVFVLPTYSAGAQVKKAQELLLKLGYDVGEPDGAWGGKSRAALNAFQTDQGFKTTRRLPKGAVSALEIVAGGTKALGKSPWTMEDRVGNTLILDNGARVHYSKRGQKIVRIKTGKIFRKKWWKKSNGTYCEYVFARRKTVCGEQLNTAPDYVIYADVKKDGQFVYFDAKSGARRFSAYMVEGKKLKP